MNFLAKRLLFCFPLLFILVGLCQAGGLTDHKIYRWVDKKGHVHFADKPNHNGAVAYTPAPLGKLSASREGKKRIAAQNRHINKMKMSLTANDHNENRLRTKYVPARTNYEFSNVSAGQKHGYVLLSGRISSHSRCQKLRVTASAKSDQGKSKRGHDNINITGFGSRLFEIKIRSSWNGSKKRPRWEITELYAICVKR